MDKKNPMPLQVATRESVHPGTVESLALMTHAPVTQEMVLGALGWPEGVRFPFGAEYNSEGVVVNRTEDYMQMDVALRSQWLQLLLEELNG